MADGPEFEIRPLAASDKSDWTRLWTAYLEFYGATVKTEVYDIYFDRLLGNDPRDFNGLLAIRQGRAVGLAHYLFHRHGWSVADTCYLQDLYTDPAARSEGVGRALIRAVYAAADRHKATDVYWLTQDFNTTARALYDKVAGVTPFIKYARGAKS